MPVLDRGIEIWREGQQANQQAMTEFRRQLELRRPKQRADRAWWQPWRPGEKPGK